MIADDIDLAIGRLGRREHLEGLAQCGGNVRGTGGHAGNVLHPAGHLLGIAGIHRGGRGAGGRLAGREKPQVVAAVEAGGEELEDRLAGKVEAEPTGVVERHAGRTVEDDDGGGASRARGRGTGNRGRVKRSGAAGADALRTP